jgi:hypothetical protein
MHRSVRCDETRDQLAELALGIADGDERARALEHMSTCAECQRELERQSAVADELLVLAPAQEPPIGFELRVLRAIHPRPERRRATLRWLAAATAVAAAVAITAGGMLLGFRDDRRLADHYRATLAQANGRYFAALPLADAAGQEGGVLFTYRGSPSWVLVTVAPSHRSAIARAELVDIRGGRIPLQSFRLVDGVWGGALPVDLTNLAAVHLLRRDGRSELTVKVGG